MSMFDRFRDRDRKVFFVCPTPVVDSCTDVGVIAGTDFGISQSSGKVEGWRAGANWTSLTIIAWADTQIICDLAILGGAHATKLRVRNYCGKLSNEKVVGEGPPPPGALRRIGWRVAKMRRRVARMFTRV